MPDWKRKGLTVSSDGTYRHDELEGVNKVTLEEVFEVATSNKEARERLAARLERLTRQLRGP